MATSRLDPEFAKVYDNSIRNCASVRQVAIRRPSHLEMLLKPKKTTGPGLCPSHLGVLAEVAPHMSAKYESRGSSPKA